jgi:hypothetical protein
VKQYLVCPSLTASFSRCGGDDIVFLEKWPEALESTTVLLVAMKQRLGGVQKRSSKNRTISRDT